LTIDTFLYSSLIWYSSSGKHVIPVLLAACLLREFISFLVAINCEDGTEYAQIFYIEELRDGGGKDERQQLKT